MKKRLGSILPALALALALLPWSEAPARANEDVTEVATWSALYAALQDDGSIRLTADVKYGEGGGDHANKKLVIPRGKSVTLDLNGHTVDRGLAGKEAVDGGYVIYVDRASLTLNDSSATPENPAGNGKLTGGNEINDAGCVYLRGDQLSSTLGTGEYARFTMNGGTITGNATESLNGGGSGVYLDWYSSFTMNGGAIVGNNWITNPKDLTPEKGQGVVSYDSTRTSFTVSGSPVIRDNVRNGTYDAASGAYTGGETGNVWVGEYIQISGPLTAAAHICVCAEPNTMIAQGSGYTITESDVARFVSDGGEYGFVLVSDPLNNRSRIRMLTAWDALQGQLAAGGTIVLQQDYSAPKSAKMLTVAAGSSVTLDLNGHTIDGANNIAEDGLISVSGTLTITDGSPKQSGALTGGAAMYYGGGIMVRSGGSVTMTAGTITGNSTGQGGAGVLVYENGSFTLGGSAAIRWNEGGEGSDGTGVHVAEGGRFTMEGGTISGNTAHMDTLDVHRFSGGGGVYVGGTFIMRGGTISGNGAAYGGGMYLNRYASFTMTGGTISGNTAHNKELSRPLGAGVYAEPGSKILVSGSPVVRGNFRDGTVGENGAAAGGTADNLYLMEDDAPRSLVTVAAPLESRAFIGVTLTAGAFAQGYTDEADPARSHALTAADVGRFHCDSGRVFYLENGKGVVTDVSIEEGWIYAPVDSTLICAIYDENGSGRLVDVSSVTFRDAACNGMAYNEIEGIRAPTSDYPFLLILVDENFVPLCPAYRNRAIE
ncbi:MAG: hypothetical protein IJU66_02215 [Oscillospiraceae bacterium]|nr:hypothetical protein [Oscillospiraceae bacterium]